MNTTRTVALSSASSSGTPTSTARRGGRGCGGSDSSYFPGCRRDANCHCEICVESFNATRDLHSALRFPPKKNTKDPPPRSAVDTYTPPSTPEPVSSVSISRSPPMKSTAKSRPKEKPIKKDKERGWAVGCNVVLVLVGVWAFLVVDSGVLAVALKKGYGPKLGMEMVREFGEESKVLERSLKGRLGVVERKVEGVVGGGKGAVCNCSSLDFVWKLNQEGHHLFFQWRCVIYQSMAEELSVWGSPLQTSGILAAGVSARSLTLLSGKITEWSEGKLAPTSRMSNGSSWTLEKWSTAAVQLEGETWVLEYQRSALFQRTRLMQSAWEILRVKLQRMVKKLKWKLLLGRTFGSAHYRNSRVKQHFEPPT